MTTGFRKYLIQQSQSANLLFHRQFILGPLWLEEFSDWTRLDIRNKFYLTIHPDSTSIQVKIHEKSITLLGFILDPSIPDATDSEIIHGLARTLVNNNGLDHFIQQTFGFGGRWNLIVDNGAEIRLFHDATGLRQVFYTDLKNLEVIWCASQPGIIADILNLKSNDSAREYINSCETFDQEYWWPGTSSLYDNAKHLLPNHYLNLETGEYYRYWPNQTLPQLSIDDCIQKSSPLLRGIMKSGASWFDLALALTSGWDSRVVLSASRDIKESIFFFTLIYWDLTLNSADVNIPKKFCQDSDLNIMLLSAPHL
jgi:hypothetical protein